MAALTRRNGAKFRQKSHLAKEGCKKLRVLVAVDQYSGQR